MCDIHMCDLTIHVCDVTHPYVWHDASTCVAWLIRMCDMSQMCDMTCAHVSWGMSYIWMSHVPHTTYIYIYIRIVGHVHTLEFDSNLWHESNVWHDPFVCVQCLNICVTYFDTSTHSKPCCKQNLLSIDTKTHIKGGSLFFFSNHSTTCIYTHICIHTYYISHIYVQCAYMNICLDTCIYTHICMHTYYISHIYLLCA